MAFVVAHMPINSQGILLHTVTHDERKHVKATRSRADLVVFTGRLGVNAGRRGVKVYITHF